MVIVSRPEAYASNDRFAAHQSDRTILSLTRQESPLEESRKGNWCNNLYYVSNMDQDFHPALDLPLFCSFTYARLATYSLDLEPVKDSTLPWNE
jgi:hypothetical protein